MPSLTIFSLLTCKSIKIFLIASVAMFEFHDSNNNGKHTKFRIKLCNSSGKYFLRKFFNDDYMKVNRDLLYIHGKATNSLILKLKSLPTKSGVPLTI